MSQSFLFTYNVYVHAPYTFRVQSISNEIELDNFHLNIYLQLSKLFVEVLVRLTRSLLGTHI